MIRPNMVFEGKYRSEMSSHLILLVDEEKLKCITQLCLTLFNPLGYSPPGSSVHGILQARILEWVAMPFSRGSSQPEDKTCVS